MVVETQQIISIKEARKLLPKKLQQNLTDEQVEFIVTRLESIAREFIRITVPKS